MRYHSDIRQPHEITMLRILIYAIIPVILAACAYKIDIQQGNVVSEEELSRLQTGMERREVIQLLGSPLLADPFHPDRWDYFYSMKRGKEMLERYHATLYFSNDRLVRIERKGPIPEKDAPQLPERRK